jgi:hypothetical protein
MMSWRIRNCTGLTSASSWLPVRSTVDSWRKRSQLMPETLGIQGLGGRMIGFLRGVAFVVPPHPPTDGGDEGAIASTRDPGSGAARIGWENRHLVPSLTESEGRAIVAVEVCGFALTTGRTVVGVR